MNTLERLKKIRELYSDQNLYFSPYFLMTNDDINGFLKAHDETVQEFIEIAKKWKKKAEFMLIFSIIQSLILIVLAAILIFKK